MVIELLGIDVLIFSVGVWIFSFGEWHEYYGEPKLVPTQNHVTFSCGSCGREDPKLVHRPEGTWGLQKVAVQPVVNLFQCQLVFLLLFITVSE